MLEEQTANLERTKAIALMNDSRAIENAVKLARGEQFDFVPYEPVTPENYKTFLNR